jgi:hypothetical protein
MICLKLAVSLTRGKGCKGNARPTQCIIDKCPIIVGMTSGRVGEKAETWSTSGMLSRALHCEARKGHTWSGTGTPRKVHNGSQPSLTCTSAQRMRRTTSHESSLAQGRSFHRVACSL